MLFPTQIIKPLFLLQPVCPLNLMLAVSYLCIWNGLDGRRNYTLTFVINILKMLLHSIFGFSFGIGANFMVTTMLIFLKTVGFVQSIVLAPTTLCIPNIAKGDYKRLSVYLSVCLPACVSVCPYSLSNSLHVGKIFMKYDAPVFF